MNKRVEVIGGVEYTYRIYKDGSEAVLFQRKVVDHGRLLRQQGSRPARAVKPSSYAELVDHPYPRVSPDEMFERASELHHP